MHFSRLSHTPQGISPRQRLIKRCAFIAGRHDVIAVVQTLSDVWFIWPSPLCDELGHIVNWAAVAKTVSFFETKRRTSKDFVSSVLRLFW